MRKVFCVCAVGILAGGVAMADFVTGFEAPDYNGSATGVDLATQQGWYVPAVGGLSPVVFTYTGNTPAFVQNPAADAGLQFMSGQTGANVARGELNFDWTTSDVWLIEYDFAGQWLNAPPAVNNLASFSLQDPQAGVRSYILLDAWDQNNLGDTSYYRAAYNYYAADGTQPTTNNPPTVFPDNADPTQSAWGHILSNHWYRFSTTIKFSENRITRVAITDLTSGITTAVNDPVDFTNNQSYYLNGGANNVGNLPMPTAFRFFTGGVAGNASAVDRLSITAVPAGCRGDMNCDGQINFADIDPFVAILGGATPCSAFNADVNGDGAINFADIDPFVALLSSGATCP